MRTYFHQLVEGIEYLHNNGFAHLDLKLENLLFDKDYNLKISDFGHSIKIRNDTRTLKGRGTEGYRAPEVKHFVSGSLDPVKADIYSLAIVLFCMTYGIKPYIEELKIKGYDLEELM